MRNRSSLSAVILVALVSIFVSNASLGNCGDDWFPCLDRALLKRVQIVLSKKGFSPGNTIGKYDMGTERALARFAKTKNISFHVGGDDRLFSAEMAKALFGIEIDYGNASAEDRLEFLKKIGVIRGK